MHPILRSSFSAIESAAMDFQTGIKSLASDHATGNRNSQNTSVALLKKLSLRIDTALCALLADSCWLAHWFWKGPNLRAIKGIQISCLANRGLIDAIALLETSHLRETLSHSNIRDLIITWCRFKKSVDCLRQALNHSAPRRKKQNWVLSRQPVSTGALT